MMIFKEIWRYWKWLCVALVSTTAILLLAATVLTYFNPPDVPPPGRDVCIESGGTWNADTLSCERAG